MGETLTNSNGEFQLRGATREENDIDVIIKIYHDCLDRHKVIFCLKNFKYNLLTVKLMCKLKAFF